MLRKFIFIDIEAGEELQLPVTPASYSIDHGINVEKVDLTDYGTINLAGNRYMMTISLNCMFPAAPYPYVNEGAIIDPMYYVEKFEKWCDNRKMLRFIISGTNVNTTCFISIVPFSEKDGTNDIYCNLTISQTPILKAETVLKKGSDNNQREEEPSSPEIDSYTIVNGDTLIGICRKYYNDTSLYPKLAAYNNIQNPNLIYAGNTITIPDKSQL